MTGLGIEYSPCIKCDKTKCSFCELEKYKNLQKGCLPENRNGISVEGTYDDEGKKYIIIKSFEAQRLFDIDMPQIGKILEQNGNVIISTEYIAETTESNKKYSLKITYKDKEL